MALILFADDSTLYLTGNDLTEIQKLVSVNSNKLESNTDKTKYVLLHRKRESSWDCNFKLGENLLERVESIKFRGGTIDKFLNWKIHADLVASKISKSLVVIRGIKQVLLPADMKNNLYYALIYTGFTYGFQV